MSPEEIEIKISKMCWGGTFARVDSTILVLRQPSLKDRNFIEWVYSDAISVAKELGMINNVELIGQLKIKKIWTDEDEKELDKLRGLVKNKPTGKTRKAKIAHRIYKANQNSLNKLNGKKHELFGISAENYAAEMRNYATIYASLYSNDGGKYWKTWDDFLSETDHAFSVL